MKTAYKVENCSFNQANYSTLVGKVLPKPPGYAVVREIRYCENCNTPDHNEDGDTVFFGNLCEECHDAKVLGEIMDADAAADGEL
jgi:cytochrome c5